MAVARGHTDHCVVEEELPGRGGEWHQARQLHLWGPKIRRAYANMGILGFADVDPEALSREDERVAQEFDRRRGS